MKKRTMQYSNENIGSFKMIIKLLFIAIVSIFVSSGCVNSEKTLPELSENQRNLLVRLGGTLTPGKNIRLGNIMINRRTNEISFPAKINMSKGPVEVLVCTQKGRLHESLLASDIDPFRLQMALVLTGAANGAFPEGGKVLGGDRFNVDVKPENGEREPVENWILNDMKKKNMERQGWVFVGSSFHKQKGCMAALSGNIININSMDENMILSFPLKISHKNNLFSVDAGKVDEIVKTCGDGKEENNNKSSTVRTTVFLYPVKSPGCKK